MDLKNSDLRIGNLFFEEYGGIYEVEGVTGCGNVEMKKGKCMTATGLYSINRLTPIPLTIEWLKRAGYKQLKRVEKTYSLGDFEDNSAILFTGVRFIHIKTGTHLEFVHEWQNLYSAIYKQELKFT